jgi:putative membrane-bound dehydrogenase-like protein
MAFDEDGRLFVCDWPDKQTGADPTSTPGRVRVLEDSDGDGVFDSSTVYSDDLPSVSAIACYAGGVFVASGPNIYYLKDTHHDGIADMRNMVLTGFGGANPPAADRLLNSFNWTLDNRIHGATAGMGGRVAFVGGAALDAVLVDKSDFSFDAKTLDLRPESGPSVFGTAFNNTGRKYSLAGGSSLRLLFTERRYSARNQYYPPLEEWVDVAGQSSPGSATAIANSASAARGAASAKGIKDPRSCVVYRGAAFPESYRGSLFATDPTARAIYCGSITESGPGATMSPPLSSAASEFLSSTDEDFQPMQLVIGPDGALYVAATGGSKDRGRILRITPDSFASTPTPHLGKSRILDLVTMLAATNGWRSDTAARLLYERQDKTAVPILSNMVARAKFTLPRIRALHVLSGLGALNEAIIGVALADSDDQLREHALVLSEGLIRRQQLPDSLFAKVTSLAGDPSVRVRRQVAFTLGEVRQPGRVQALAQILGRDPANSEIVSAVMSALGEGGGAMLAILAGDARFRNRPESGAILSQLAIMIGVQGRLAEVAQVIEFLDRSDLNAQLIFSLMSDLGEGLHRTRSSLSLVDASGRLRRFYAQALNASVDGSLVNLLRVQAIRLLGQSPYTFLDVADLLFLIVGSGETQEIQSATIDTLVKYSDSQVLPNFLARWRALSPALRAQAVAGLLRLDPRVPAVLSALENGSIQRDDVSSDLVNFLRTHRDPAIQRRAVALFGPLPVTRTDMIARFKPALTMRADARRGTELFTARCAACHTPRPGSPPAAPELPIAGSKDKVLGAILNPNLGVHAAYRPRAIETRAGETFIGLVNDDRPDTIVVSRRDGSREIWPVSNIASTEPQSWSWMPMGLEEGLTPQSMADLLEFVSNRK